MDDRQSEWWELLTSEPGPELPLFKAEFRYMQNSRNGHRLKAIVLQAPHTVNMIALTTEMQWILVEQYRFGLSAPLIELPAGFIDHHETPLEAAKRELLEETGYMAETWIELGWSHINPAYVTNCCYHFLAREARYVGDGSPDESEDLKVHLQQLQGLHEVTSSRTLCDAVGCAAIWNLQKYLDQ